MNTKVVWSIVGLVLFVGCVPSMHAIYTDKDIVFKPEFLGTWQKHDSPETWEFSKHDDKSYRLVYTDRQGHSGSFVAHLADVDGTMFLDLFPEQRQDATPGFYRFHQVPIHSIYLVKQAGERVVLSGMDYEWLEKHLNDHPAQVPSATFSSRKMITASTEQLQNFLVGNRDRFVHDFELVRAPVPEL